MSLDWLENSFLGFWVRESEWGYPIALTSHAIGMAVVVGTVLMFDARMLGYARQVSVRFFERLFPLAWCGFALNFLSGAALFSGDPNKFLGSTAFLVKLGLIGLGGLSLWMLGRAIDDSSDDQRFDSRTRWAAASSLCFWVGAIVAGRLIAYTT